MKKNIDELLKKKGVNFTEQQKLAVHHTSGPMLVLAVPGAGKTTVIMGRIANLIINEGVRADQILAITFSKASAMDMTNRFNSLFKDDGIGSANFSTIHAFGNWVVTSYNRKFGKNNRLITAKEIKDVIRTAYNKATGDFLTEDSFEAYTTAISYIKNKMLTEDETEDYIDSSRVESLRDIIDAYEGFKKDNNLFDYDDMLIDTIKILKSNKVTLEFLQKKYTHIILDEGQDTSVLQYEIIKLLTNHKTNEEKNVCIVADDDQNIYGFRGADNKILLAIKSIFPNIKMYYMEYNFRSQENITKIANKLIENNIGRYKKSIVATREKSSKVKIVNTGSIKSQLNYITKELKTLKGSTAILYKFNIDAIPLANALKESGVEFGIHNFKSGFFNHWVVKDMLAIAKLVEDESDTESFKKVYYKLETYLSKNVIKFAEQNKPKDESVLQFIVKKAKVSSYQKENVIDVIETLELARTKKPSVGISKIVSRLGYIDYLEKITKGSDAATSVSHIQIVDAFIEIIKGVENYSEIENKFKELEKHLLESRGRLERDIRISTIHSSKGLEYDNVFLININKDAMGGSTKSNTFNINSKEIDEELEEERRLLYVGITRAKNNLTIISSEIPSSFIDEIDKNSALVEKIRVR